MTENIIIIGGGIAGLVSAIRLARNHKQVKVIDKNSYPRHKVCGEYLSQEVLSFLKKEELIPNDKELPAINLLKLSAPSGKNINIPLEMGGIGISRYYWENYLYNKALEEGVEVIIDAVVNIHRDEQFIIETRKGLQLTASLVIGAYGKRSTLDKKLNRSFFDRKSPYVGVKFHAYNPEIRANEITLHNFNGGYCGVSRVEDDIVNYCYLCERDLLREAGNIDSLESLISDSNPLLANAFSQATRLFEKPLVINEISFETKSPVENGIPMVGDAAGMITPLCGNGMAMAVHSAKIISDIIAINDNPEAINTLFAREWNNNFKSRLAWGRTIQKTLFGKNWASSIAILLGNYTPALASNLVKKTHGKEI